jgi:hypothetical protein
MVLDDLAHLRLGALKPTLRGVWWGLMHLGLWMLPLLILRLPSWSGAASGSGRLAVILVLGSIAGVVTAGLWFFGTLMPLGSPGNILVDFGIGVRDLSGSTPHARPWFWVLATFASAFGAASLLLAVAQVARRGMAAIRSGQARQSLWLAAFLLVGLAVYYGPFCFAYRPWFDRYLLPAMALVALLLMAEPLGVIRLPEHITGAGALLASTLALSYLVFAVAATHDYLAWNRQRWMAARSLMTTGVAAADNIDGGYAFNGYYAWRDVPRGTALHERDWKQAKQAARHMIAFSSQRGYREVGQLLVDRWLPLCPDRIVILERNKDPP